MKTAILHLTDIHITSNFNQNHILKKAEKIFESFRNQISDSENLTIVVTGDIAFSGLKVEYDLAYNFFNELLTKIEAYRKQKPSIIFIPGNHDCDFSGDQTIRNILINDARQAWYKKINETIINACSEVQNNFWDFVNRFNSYQLHNLYNHKLLNIVELNTDAHNIVINCFNTSWISKLQEEEGQMAFPTEYFSEDVLLRKSNLTINLIHHPINWQNNLDHREFRKLLEESGDLILSGHEHETTQREVSELGGQTTVYLESGALQTDIVSRSSFNLYIFDLESESYSYLEYQLIDGNYVNKIKLDDRRYDHRYKLAKKEYSLDQRFLSYLNSSDAQYTHPHVDNVLLSDIYVNIKLREISLDEKDSLTLPKYVSVADLKYRIDESLRWCVLGAESSGKTALLKVVAGRLYSDDYVPIFIKGESLKEINVEKLTKVVKAAFNDQYDKKCHNNFEKLDKNKVVLLIDNFQNCTLPAKFKIKMLLALDRISEKQIFSSNTMLVFDAMKDEKSGETINYFQNFTSYQIAELGADLRYDLIHKWNCLGRDLTNDSEKNDVIQLNNSFKAQIKTTLGVNYIPSHPFYILTLLTSLSNGKSNSDYSLSGYYYESLISKALDDSVIDKDALQFYNQFLCEFFYFLFHAKIKNIAMVNFDRFYEDFSRNYTTTENLETVKRALHNAKILRFDGEYVTLTYRYVYYYFVAKFFANNITISFHREEVSKMCERLYREEFSNVIVFLTHLSKDPFIINEIYTNARSQFSDVAITELGEDILNINKLVDEIPQLVLNDAPVEENRTLKYLSEAEDEEIEREFEKARASLDYDVNEDVSTLDFLNQLIRSIKTYELLGQITKKYWGSIKGPDKYTYAKETFDLSLRTLNTYFQFILQHNDGIVAALKYIAKKKEISDLTSLREMANSYIFKLCCMVSQGSIQRVSNSIGHRKLKETFESIVRDNPNNSYRILDVAIKLDHAAFPIKEIDELTSDSNFNRNFLPKFLLQNMVYNHGMIFITNIKEKQAIYDKLHIKVPDQRRVELSSVIQK